MFIYSSSFILLFTVEEKKMPLTSEDFPCTEPEVLLAKFVQKHVQHSVINCQVFRQHEVHCV